MNPSELKLIVQEKYGKIASSDDSVSGSCCCTPACCSSEGISTFNESYDHLDGYVPDADLSLGCGVPVDFADIRPGDSILDLGSGAGNDCFVARSLTGDTGHVTGLDFTEPMLRKAEKNRKKLGYNNVEFIRGDIEAMPLSDETYDVVLSNCVLNLVPDKGKAFSEIFRVLKSGGHFCVSDVVVKGTLSEDARSDAELYAGCVSGASAMDEYIGFIKERGFSDITIHKEKRIQMPDAVLDPDEEQQGNGVFSITVSAHKK
ncbi:MAG: arsenite methyltransferase [Bacteroidales bacterium]|nr:arsenite methyltransferase [Bacteroidales bacterium]MDT8372780.1 arsenite methyltransferase [Bacteroidales bacterium]